MAVEAVFGDRAILFSVLPHPKAVIGRLIRAGAAKLDRPRRSLADRRVRGGMMVAVMVAGAALAGVAVTFASHAVPHLWLFEAMVVAAFLGQRRVYRAVGEIGRALGKGQIDVARRGLATLDAGAENVRLEPAPVAGAAVRGAGAGFATGVLAPVVWYALTGLPGLLAYQAAAGLDAGLGRSGPKSRAFGRAAVVFFGWFSAPTTCLAGFVVAAAAAFVPAARPARALRMAAAARRSWPEAAMVGALGLAADDRFATGARPGAPQVRQALSIYAVACLMAVGVVAGMLWLTLASGRS